MSPHQTIAVAVRLFAVWLVIYTARTAPSFYRESVNAGDPNASIAIIVIVALVVLVVLFLWSFPLTVARTLLDTKSPVAPEPASPDTWFAVGCALLGLWLIVPALAALVYRLSALYMAQRNGEIETSSTGLALVYYAAEIALGIWLLLGARGARRLFWWARHAR